MDTTKRIGEEPPRVELLVWMARTGRRATDVARLLGISKAAMSEYLRVKYDFNVVTTEALSRASGIPAERLVADQRTSAALKRLRRAPKLKPRRRPTKARHV